MIRYFSTKNGPITEVEKCSRGTWVCVTAPTDAECKYLTESFPFDPDYLKYSLDEEETSRIEAEDGNTLIIIDIPHVVRKGENVEYTTFPIGIIVTRDNVITVTLHETPIIEEFSQGVVRGLNTEFRTQFVLKLILRAANRYLQYLRQIDRLSTSTEKELRSSMKNSDLIKLLDISKSLVYFSTSLKANEITLEKMMRGRYIKLYDEDQDLLEDVIIEIKQAIEMAGIYANVLNGTLETSGSLISNNLNIVMKVLAGITIVINIPTIISGLYGMNIENGYLPFSQFWWFPCLLSVVIMAVVAWVLHKKDML